MPRRRRCVFASRPACPTGAAPCGSSRGACAAAAGRGEFWPRSCGRARARRRHRGGRLRGPRDPRHRPPAGRGAPVRRRVGDGRRCAMRNLLDDDTKKAYSQKRFNATYRAAERAATATAVRTGKVQKTRGGRFVVPVAVRTRVFGTLRGVVVLPMVQGRGGEGRVRWRPFLRLPGLRPGESVHAPRALPAAAARRSSPPTGGAWTASGHGRDRRHAARRRQPRQRPRAALRPAPRRPPGRGAALRPPPRSAACKVRRGQRGPRDDQPGLCSAPPSRRSATGSAASRSCARATASVLALGGPRGLRAPAAGLDVQDHHALGRARSTASPTPTSDVSRSARSRRSSGRQAAQRERRVVRRDARRRVRRVVQLGLRPARRQARRQAPAGRNAERVRVQRDAAASPPRRPSTISPAAKLRDSLAVGAAAIGQDRDLATPLAMAERRRDDRRPTGRPRAAAHRALRRRCVRRRAVSARRSRAQVRAMMLGVVRCGHRHRGRDPRRRRWPARPAPPSCDPTAGGRRTRRTPTPGSSPSRPRSSRASRWR